MRMFASMRYTGYVPSNTARSLTKDSSRFVLENTNQIDSGSNWECVHGRANFMVFNIFQVLRLDVVRRLPYASHRGFDDDKSV